MGIRRWVRQWILNEDSQKVINKYWPETVAARDPMLGEGLNRNERTIRLTIHNASGGRVVETSTIDNKTERTMYNLYIITRDQEFGKEIDKILTLESLKN